MAAKIYDSDHTANKETNNGPYEVELTLVPNSSYSYSGTSISGISTLTNDSGILNFTDLYILSYGTFKILANSSQDIESVESEEFTVINTIKSFDFTINPSVSTFKDLEIYLNLTGVDDNPFIQATNVTLISNATDLIIANDMQNSESSSFVFSLFSRKAETVNFTLTAEYADKSQSNDTSASFYPATLKLVDYSEPEYYNNSFFMKYSVFEDEDSEIVLKNADNVTVNLTFNCIPNTDLQSCNYFLHEGVDSVQTSNGDAMFAELRILSVTEFNVTATVLDVDINPNTSQSFIVTSKPKFNMTFSIDVIFT